MKLLNKVAVTLVMGVSMLAVSSTAFSAEEKDKNVAVANAAKHTEAKMLEAKSMLEKGGVDGALIQEALNDARQAQKEFRYEATERTRQKLQEKLKTSREALIKHDNEKALADLNDGLVIFAEMKKVYDAAH
jgi:membrane-bound lytic murein transglycosylase B